MGVCAARRERGGLSGHMCGQSVEVWTRREWALVHVPPGARRVD